MELQLVVSQDPDGQPPEVFRFPDFERVTLGRGPDSPVPLEGSLLSRDHVRFEMREDRLCVTDLSSNGSFVNGRRLAVGAPRALDDGDEVGLPGYRISYRLTAPEVAPTEEQAAPEPKPGPGSAAETKQEMPSRPAAVAARFHLSALEWIVIALAVAVGALALIYFSY